MSMSGALGAGLTASLGDHDTVIFQNGLMKNVRSKAAGGNGMFFPLLSFFLFCPFPLSYTLLRIWFYGSIQKDTSEPKTEE